MKKLLILLATLGAPAYGAAGEADAEQIVKSHPCADGETIDQYLGHKLSSSHRDLGWRVFPAEGGVDVERAFLASKSMEIRYRWRVDGTGQVQAISDRAQSLCS
ncbi:hypothetical protein [Methylogaea oryzae]|uniref:Secreted protein n=2 Tax=Methylogaea oryzae TaxID=1295382 RepID=A0A8D4VJY1_9GAMM|nr:hypothetical protein [Methylogaea oryzae]BBL69458.1 hypothetical protein MoryE10_00640 [Methylogaea oryzae]